MVIESLPEPPVMVEAAVLVSVMVSAAVNALASTVVNVVGVIAVKVNATSPSTTSEVRLVEVPSVIAVRVFADPVDVIVIVSAPFVAAEGWIDSVPAVTLLRVMATLSADPLNAVSVNPKVALVAVFCAVKAVEVELMLLKTAATVELLSMTLVTPVADSSDTVPSALNVAFIVSILLIVACMVFVSPTVTFNRSVPSSPSNTSSDVAVIPSVELKEPLKVSLPEPPVNSSASVVRANVCAVSGV